MVVKMISAVHPSIEHNLAKIRMLKRAMFQCELEEIQGGYFEFGVFEGTSLYAAVQLHKSIHSKLKRNFYGFDSFDEGFKYFDARDKHPFFKEGDFKSSFVKVSKRLKKFENVKLIKGYFEDTVQNKPTADICGKDLCAILFIDCDLMGPAGVALNFIKPILQQGTIIILDDYWGYKGSANLGICGAMEAFLAANPGVKVRDYYSYGYGGHSFIVTAV